jgi:hypothetical protein
VKQWSSQWSSDNKASPKSAKQKQHSQHSARFSNDQSLSRQYLTPCSKLANPFLFPFFLQLRKSTQWKSKWAGASSFNRRKIPTNVTYAFTLLLETCSARPPSRDLSNNASSWLKRLLDVARLLSCLRCLISDVIWSAHLDETGLHCCNCSVLIDNVSLFTRWIQLHYLLYLL